MQSPRVVVVDNYDSFTYNLVQLVGELIGARPRVVRHDVPLADVGLSWATHIILSPGPGRPDRREDFGVCAQVIREARVPVLGVCLGHQGIALAYGGQVRAAPRVVHGYRSTLRHDGRGLFEGLGNAIQVVRYHSLAVAEPLPPTLRVTARSEDGVVMALEHTARPLFGIQFHPESILSEAGQAILANFLAWPMRGQAVRAPTVDRSAPRRSSSVPDRPPPRPRRSLRVRQLGAFLDAQQCFDRLCADEPLSFWLDSSSLARPSARVAPARFSYMGVADDELGVDEPDALTALAALDDELALAPESEQGVPFPFLGGYVGALAYGIDAPRLQLLRVTRFLAVDHWAQQLYLCALDDGEWLDIAERKLRTPAPPRARVEPVVEPGEFHPGLDKEQYVAAVERCLAAIRAGDSYELCLTDQLRLGGAHRSHAAQLYQRLRCHNPAPYAAYLSLSDRAVLSSSPELFLSVDQSGRAVSKPIKGTRPRAANAELDALAREALVSSPKDRAENLMIADLVRNDLGRVAQLGTVRCDPLMDVESFATVHQLVTTVSAQLDPAKRLSDIIEATFPPGSMTGAPKRRATELLAAWESGARGIYAGAIGYLGLGRVLELAVAIRTAVVFDDHIAVGAGGAIVHGSTAESEYDEMRHKASAVIAALSRPLVASSSGEAAAQDLEARAQRAASQRLDAGFEQ